MLAQTVTEANAKSILLYDMLRRWRETPRVADTFPGATLTAV